MNVAACWERENKITKKKKAEECKQLTNFKEAACFPSVVIQRSMAKK